MGKYKLTQLQGWCALVARHKGVSEAPTHKRITDALGWLEAQGFARDGVVDTSQIGHISASEQKAEAQAEAEAQAAERKAPSKGNRAKYPNLNMTRVRVIREGNPHKPESKRGACYALLAERCGAEGLAMPLALKVGNKAADTRPDLRRILRWVHKGFLTLENVATGEAVYTAENVASPDPKRVAKPSTLKCSGCEKTNVDLRFDAQLQAHVCAECDVPTEEPEPEVDAEARAEGLAEREVAASA